MSKNPNKKLKISDGDLAVRVSSLFSTGQLTKTTVGLGNADNTSDVSKPVSSATQTALNSKQDVLVSGTSIKTLNSSMILGAGDIALTSVSVGLGNVDNTSDLNKPVSSATQTALNSKQDVLVSGTNIKTLNSGSLLGAGDIALTKTSVGLGNVDNTSDVNKPVSTATQTALNAKVSTSVTVNGHALSSNINVLASEIVGSVVSVSTSSSVAAWATVIVASAASAPISITLPAISSSTIGQYVAVIKADSSANTVGVVANGANTLNGSVSAQTLGTQWDAYIVSNDGVSSAYTIAKPGTGGSGSNIFQLNGTGQAYTTYVTGIGTSTPAATLDVETAPTLATTTSNYGVAQCPVDEFGYANIVSATSKSSVSVAAHTISVGGTNYPISSTNITGLASAPVYYVFSDGISGTALATQVPNELFLSATGQPGAYLNFENGLFDPFLNAWGNALAGTLTIDSTTSKFGSSSYKSINGASVLQLAQQNKTIADSKQYIYFPVWPTWQMDAWFFVSNYGTSQSPFMSYRSGSWASGYGWAIYNAGGGSQSMILYLSTNGSAWNVASGSALNGTAPLNQWFQMSIRFDSNLYTVSINGTTTTFASNVNLYSPASAYTYYPALGTFSGSNVTMNVDEVIITPYARSFGAASAFTYTNNCTTGSPFAAYLTGASLTDGYNLNWYGSNLAGPNYPAANPSFTLNGTSGFAWAPICPYLNQCGEWTVEAYINLSSIPAAIPLIDFRSSNIDFSFFVQLNSTSQLAIFIGTTGTTWDVFNGVLVAVTAATWFHLAITYSATRGGYAIYINGVLKNSSTSVIPISPTSQVVLGTTSSSFHSGTAFTAYMNCFRISPTLVYTGAFTAPTSMLGTNVSRDLITASTGACNTQGASASLTNKRVYLGSVRLDLQRVRAWTPKQAQQPLAKMGQVSVWRDGSLTSPMQSYQLPAPACSNSYRFMAVLRGDGRLYIGGDYTAGAGFTGVPVTSGTYDQYYPVPTQTALFRQLVIGFNNYFGVDFNNTVWACGANTNGTFGDGTVTGRTVLTPIYNASGVPTISISNMTTFTIQSLFIIDSGNMYSCGSNAFGQLGQNSSTQLNTLTLVPKIGGQNWAAAWQYGQATWAMTDAASGNKLYACGNNTSNILGVGSVGGSVLVFTQCVTVTGTPITNVKKVVSAVENATQYLPVFVITNDGFLYVTGHAQASPNHTPGTGSQFAWLGPGFMGPICDNVVDMCMTGGDDFGALIMRADSTLWMFNSANSGFTANASAGAYCYNIQKAVTGTFGEYTPVASIYGNSFSATGANMALTNSGSLLVAGSSNAVSNSFGATPINSNIYVPYEIRLAGDRIVACLFTESFDTVLYANTFLQTQTGKIFAAGSQYTALGGKYNTKQTYIPLQFG